MSDITSLPDFPTLQQLSRALWRTGGGRGAAVLVGAGLSRTARLAAANSPPPPLWPDISRELAARLYAGRISDAPADPLRLAEEYRTYFGQASLDELLRSLVSDGAWSPSETHGALLALPWADVLTTNYDTLLERAARLADREYEPVACEADLAHARAPRIVKLHGSMGASERFVIAEEDYRSYPERHAAFVNLARQVFVENELALIGFSGDDPNFAAWSGWVRDHLGATARRIYLVGALDLGPAKRKFLEARNVAPIDLADLVRHLDPAQRHRAAVDLLLAHLAAARPKPAHLWSPAAPTMTLDEKPAEAAARLASVAERWGAERASYPGWVVCPGAERRQLRLSVDSERMPDQALDAMPGLQAAGLMVELCWRHRTALWPMHPTTVERVGRLAPPDGDTMLSREDRLLVARTLAWQTRFDGDWARFAEMDRTIAALAPARSDATAEIAHLAAARACLEMRFDEIPSLADRVLGDDPFWGARRAAMLAEAGLQHEAEDALREALADLRERSRMDRGSIWVDSRLAWAEMLARAMAQSRLDFRPWDDRHRAFRSDPFEEVSGLRDRILERMGKEPTTGRVPRFEPGRVKDRSQTLRFRSWSEMEPFTELDLMLLDGGVPPRLEHVSLFLNERRDALRLAGEDLGDRLLHVLRAVGGQNDDLEEDLNRLAVAHLRPDAVRALAARVHAGAVYWLERLTSRREPIMLADSRLALHLRVLARLAVRLDADEAERLYLWGLGVAGAIGGPAHADVFKLLLEGSWSAIPPQRRPDLVADTLDLPLAAAHGGVEPTDWIFATPADRAAADPRRSGWTRAWITAARDVAELRPAALKRLLLLRQAAPLTADEETSFAEAVWSRRDAGSPALPASTQIRPSFWHDVARPDGLDPADAVRRRVFADADPIGDDRLVDLRVAIEMGRVGPSGPQAAALLASLCGETPADPDPGDPGAVISARFAGRDAAVRRRLLGYAIAALAGAIDSSERTAARGNLVAGFAERNRSVVAASALLRFAEHAGAPGDVARRVRAALRSTDEGEVYDALEVVLAWQDRAFEPEAAAELDGLVETLVSSIEFRRTHALRHLLLAASRLVGAGLTTLEQNDRLAVCLEELLAEADYRAIEAGTEEAGSVSLVRAACVRLACALAAKNIDAPGVGTWLAVPANDPLPEVRFALLEEQ
ncbi:SIR2 family NAD-dependent protein deacylase [Sphingomonas sp. Leaf4]|uniref:SIR2 family NAD-dependent protein deacylase n=1 Tax=Sphingomonas sp. Leaf4 TaxID=2876553 RepID=UPI001E4605ED|nr:SIR2 family protein [Sphingomonas sp. Leaf4]